MSIEMKCLLTAGLLTGLACFGYVVSEKETTEKLAERAIGVGVVDSAISLLEIIWGG